MGRREKWILAFAALGLAGGVLASLRPWQIYRQEAGQQAAAQTEMRKVQAEHKELLQQQAKLDSGLGREELARERGYRKPNEESWQAPR